VEIENQKDMDAFSAFIFKKAQEEGTCLVIVNTKKEAREAFERVKSYDMQKQFEIYHLSTSMCSAHRFDVIEKVRKGLNEKKKMICIATQLIEAGVDISFTCVIRAMAGLDSIAQAAGRCNRNRESTETKSVFVVPLADENLDKLQDIKIGKELTSRVINENKNADFLSQEMLDKFYTYYFYKRKDEMNFSTGKGETIYEMLSKNCSGTGYYKNRTGENFNHFITHAFASADECFEVIASNTESVVVHYGEADSLIKDYKQAFALKEKIRIIRQLEKYSVSLYRYEIDRFNQNRAIIVLDNEFGIKILENYYYLSDFGVIMNIDPQALIISEGSKKI
jgi:CRISPR-associated endonuclease/helicase Cas3